MNPNLGQDKKEVLPRDEYVKGFRRLGEGGFAKCIADLFKSSSFPPKVPPYLNFGLGHHLKEIFMDEMRVFQHFGGGTPTGFKLGNVDRFLEVTIIDDPHYVYPNIFLIEDKKKSVGVLLVDDMDRAHAPEFQFGAVLRLENPDVIPIADPLNHFYLNSCQKPNICIATVVGKKEDMCRYCLKENAEKKCSECKRRYCGKECQEKDWKFQNHKTLCKLPARRFTN